MVVRSVDGKIIGDIENGVFTKKVQASKHMLQKPLAWGIDSEAYKKDVRPNCHTIVIIDKESGTTYRVGVDVFDDKMKFLNRGFGGQYFLVLKYWQVIAPGQRSLW